MPTVEHPSYYSRSKGDEARTYEQTQFFRNLTPDNAVSETGSTEQPLGHVMLVSITFADIVEYLPSDSTLADLSMLGVEPGWYIVKADDNGLIWAMTYGQGTFGEEQARADYAEAEAVALAWDLAEDQVDEEPVFTHGGEPPYETTCCTFLGHFEGHDLYCCPDEPTVIARYGNEGSQYKSGISFIGRDPHLGEAHRRAVEACLIEGKV